MDTIKLETLLATIRTGSFSKAAKELHCTQSAVSQMMNALENELGCRVLVRTHEGVTLSGAGETLFPSIVEAAGALEKLKREARLITQGKALPIRLGSFSSISNTWLPALLQGYEVLHPDVNFNIQIGTDAITDWLMTGKIDVALGDDERCRAFRWHPLMEDEYYAVLPEGCVAAGKTMLTQEEFAAFPFIMAPRNVLDKHLQTYSSQQTTISCDDDSTLLSMVSQGMGMTAMPKLSLHHVPAHVQVLTLVPKTKRVLGIATRNEPSKAVEEFVRFVVNEFKRET
jgi:DNA-binding transcriptional LysR family regulator